MARHAGIAKKRPVLKIVLITIAAFLLAAVIGFFVLCQLWLKDLPDCSEVEDFNKAAATEVYANDHETLLARFQLEYRIPLESLDKCGSFVVMGTVATEDERFYKHIGVDPIGITRALVNNITGGSIEGASTITQQLVRNTVLADEMNLISYERKFREAYVALKLENLLSKDEILLLYLNTINYGDGAYGIEAAARHYFGKSASELSLSESALLVGIPQSPMYNNPVYYPEHALERRNIVLKRMLDNGYITQEEYDVASAEEIVLNITENSNDGILLYPYFASYVRQELYNSYDLTTSEIFQGGMKVYTTLDPDIQEKAEVAAANKEEGLPSNLEVALVAIDPENGYIKAMVGGRDYYNNQYNLASQGARQAGSSFKTFTLIAALENGISPSQVVNCGESVQIGGWKVSNIYGIDYGTRSIQGAFAVSSNTGFARLIAAVGPEKVVEVAHRMGISSELGADLSLTLGTSEVTPLEMARAYATIANGGTCYPATAIELIEDRKGNVIVDNTKVEGEYALSPEVARAAIDVMRTVINGGTGTDARLESGQDAAGKTGTSENYRDSWFCGITPQLSVAIWLGDRSNTSSVPSNISAASVFSDFLDAVISSDTTESFFTAGSPQYTRWFEDGDLGVAIENSSEKEKEEKEKKEKEEKEKAEEEARKKAEEEAAKEQQNAVESDAEGNGGEAEGGLGGGTEGNGSDGAETPQPYSLEPEPDN